MAAQEKDRLDAGRHEDGAQYELDPADVIKEEDYEESVGEMSYRKSSRLAMIASQSNS